MKTKKYLKILPIIFIILIWFVSFIAIIVSDGNWNEKSDMFNIVNSFISILVLSGTIYAISLQRNDLKLQREELKLQRKELSISSEAQASLVDIEWFKLFQSNQDIAKAYFPNVLGKENENIILFAFLVQEGVYRRFRNKHISEEQLREMYTISLNQDHHYMRIFLEIYLNIEQVKSRVSKFNSNTGQLNQLEKFDGIIAKIYEEYAEKA